MDASGLFSCSFWSTVMQSKARLPLHTLNYWTILSVVPVFLYKFVLECDIAHRRSVAELWMLHMISVTRCTCSMALSQCRTRQCGLHAVLWSLIGILRLMRLLAVLNRSTPGLLFTSPHHCDTILVTKFSTVMAWRVLRAGLILSHWSILLPPFLSSTIFSFFSFFL